MRVAFLFSFLLLICQPCLAWDPTDPRQRSGGEVFDPGIICKDPYIREQEICRQWDLMEWRMKELEREYFSHPVMASLLKASMFASGASFKFKLRDDYFLDINKYRVEVLYKVEF